MAKKKLNENTEEKVNAKVNETEAADSLHPAARAQDDPKSMTHKSALLAKMIGASHAATSDELVKLFNGMMAWHDKAGHGPGVGDVAGKNHDSVDMGPSAASKEHNYGDVKMSAAKSATSINNPSEELKAVIAQDVANLLEGTEGLDETFKENVKVLFEAAIEARVGAIEIQLTEAYNEALETEVDGIANDLVKGVDQYLDYVTGEWLTENQIAVESTLRNEMAASLITDLSKVLKEHNINISEEQVEVVEAMSAKIDELESRLNDVLGEKAELEDYVESAEKDKTLTKMCEGLTLVESEKLRELSTNIDAEDLETFEKKVSVLKESNFVKKTAKKEALNEALEGDVSSAKPEETEEKKEVELAPSMKKYSAALSRSLYRV